MNARIVAAVSAASVCGLTAGALAAPYASGVSEAAGNVTFILNEPADEIVVIRDGVASSLGALGVGSHTFARQGAANYSIVARKNAGPGYTTLIEPNVGAVLQISDDNNIRNSFNAPRGLAVNLNPANGTLFGRIYVSNAAAGFTSGFPTPFREVGDGIYINNADGSATPAQPGDTALTAGIDFGASANSPFRLALDADGFLYISDWADPTGTVYRTDPNVTTGGNMLAGQGSTTPIAPSTTLNHGSVGGLALTGSLAAGNLTLYTLDEDLDPDGEGPPTSPWELNSVWRYDVGGGPVPTSQIPTQLARQLLISDFTPGGIYVDLARGPDGKLYLAQNRSVGTEPGIVAVASDGITPIFDSLTETLVHELDFNDVMRNTRGIEVSPDGRFLGAVRSNSDSTILPLLAGVPDLVNRIELDTFDNIVIGREIAFDAANNLYVVSSGNQALRVFSPGGLSVTSYNSNGTFVMDPTYTAGAGDYSNSDSWLIGVVPNGANHVARFAGTGGNVNIDVPLTVGAIKFDSASSYTLSGINPITLAGASPNVISRGANHTISAPLALTQSSGLVADGGILTVSNLQFSASPVNPIELYTGGTGVVAVNRVLAQRLHVVSGTTRIIPNGTTAATSNVKRLTISGGAAPIARLDITNNAFVVDYASGDPSPFDTIRAQIISGYAGGTWSGNGIMSSVANASQFGIGYSEASALASVPAIFGSVDATAVLFRLTRYGDANLDGVVNLADFNRLAANFGASGATWAQGDFTYDGLVNLADFNRLAANFGQQAGPDGPTPDDWAALASAVPEPASLSLLGIAAVALVRRRRRA